MSGRLKTPIKIEVEGIDGSCKTTSVQWLRNELVGETRSQMHDDDGGRI